MVFSAQASARKVGIRDQFQVTFTLSNAPGADNFRPPSFAGFTVAGGPFQSNSSNTSIVNGQVRQTSSIHLTYVLVPQKTGTFTIPAARVEVNGKDVASNTITLEVVSGSVAQQRVPQRSLDPWGDDDPFAAMRQMQQRMQQMMQQSSPRQQIQPRSGQLESMSEKNIGKNIFIRVEADKTNPHVGEQITVSYKLYTRLAMSVNLTALPSLNGFWSQDFQIPNPPRPTEEVINGQRYQVFLLKKTALFPQQDGVLELDAAKAEGVVRVIEQVKGRNPFADDPAFGSFFMDDPFFNEDMFSGYNYKDVPVKLSSQPLKIHVRPLPLAGQPESFTGAVGNFTVKATLDKSSLSTDETANLVFTVSGSGNIKLIGNPKVDFPPELGAYEPQVTDTITGRSTTISGSKVFSYNLSPQTAGDYVIPGISFSYYDPASGTYKTQTTEPVRIHVTQGRNYTAAAGAKKLPGDIHDIMRVPVWSASSPVAGKLWYWLCYLGGAAVLAAMLVRKRQQEAYAGNEALFRNKKANKVAWKRLATARKLLPQQQHKEFYEEVSKAIWLYLSDKLGIPLAHLSKDTISGELEHKQVPVPQIDRVKKLVLECEMALYSPGGGQLQRRHTLEEAAALIEELESVLKNKNRVLQHA